MPNSTVFIISLFLSTMLAFSVNAGNNKNKLPEIGFAGSSILSIDKEKFIGGEMMKNIRATQPVLYDPVLTEYINDIGNRMVRHAKDVHYNFDFFIIKNKELNAFAFFGGHIAIHSGLITTAATESELASVIAHEISHVTQRHLARRLEAQTRSQPLTIASIASSVLLTLINPSVGFAALTTTMAASQQAGINYTRGNEKEADRVGIQLLARSGFNPQGTPDFFARLAAKYRYTSKPPAILLTHPLPESRIADARIRAQNLSPRPLAPNLGFELTKARIKARHEGDAKKNIVIFSEQIKQKKYKIIQAAKYGLALSFFESEQYNNAKKILENLWQFDKENLFYIDALTDVYIATKQFNKAIQLLDNLNRLIPNNQVIVLNYANVLQETKQFDKAALILQTFLAIKPDDFLSNSLLTTIYQKQEKKDLMHVSQAEVYALLGVYQKAIDELQTGYTHIENNPLLKQRIKGRIYQLQQRQERIKRL